MKKDELQKIVTSALKKEKSGLYSCKYPYIITSQKTIYIGVYDTIYMYIGYGAVTTIWSGKTYELKPMLKQMLNESKK